MVLARFQPLNSPARAEDDGYITLNIGDPTKRGGPRSARRGVKRKRAGTRKRDFIDRRCITRFGGTPHRRVICWNTAGPVIKRGGRHINKWYPDIRKGKGGRGRGKKRITAAPVAVTDTAPTSSAAPYMSNLEKMIQAFDRKYERRQKKRRGSVGGSSGRSTPAFGIIHTVPRVHRRQTTVPPPARGRPRKQQQYSLPSAAPPNATVSGRVLRRSARIKARTQ